MIGQRIGLLDAVSPKSAVIRCPRCSGTWWRVQVFHELLDSPETPELTEAVVTGQGVPCHLPVSLEPKRGERVLYVCGGCSFPGIEPQEPRPYDDSELIVVRR